MLTPPPIPIDAVHAWWKTYDASVSMPHTHAEYGFAQLVLEKTVTDFGDGETVRWMLISKVLWNRCGRELRTSDLTRLILQGCMQNLWSIACTSDYLTNVGIQVSFRDFLGEPNYKGFSVEQEEDWQLAVQELVRLLNKECPRHVEIIARRKDLHHFSLDVLNRMPMTRLFRLLCKDPSNLPIGMCLE